MTTKDAQDFVKNDKNYGAILKQGITQMVM